MLRQYQAGCFKRKRKGQSTVEYIILVAGVIAALLIFLRPNGPFSVALNGTWAQTASKMNSMANRIANAN